MPRVTKDQLNAKISELEEKVKKLQVEKEAIKQDSEERQKTKEQEYKTVTDQLNSKISALETDVKSKQTQLNKRELKKLAEAFNEQEESYKDDAQRWFMYVISAFIVLAASITYSVHEASGKDWQDKIGYYLINFIAITFLIFALKHFSYFIRLSNDYANRKTLAQSYNNILSTEEDGSIRQKFLDKATDILCAPSDVKHESYTVPEKVIDVLSEVSKNLSKKI